MSPKTDASYKYFEDAYFEKRVWVPSANISNYLMFFSRAFIGEKTAHGRQAFKNLVVTLSESEIVPKVIVFWNRSSKVCLVGSSLLRALGKLEQAGVKILVSGAYLEENNLKDQLRAGKLANNFDLLEVIHKAQKVVSL